MKLAERVDKLEASLITHLEESGSIRTDLAWLKKAFWTLAVAYVGAVAAQFVPIVHAGVSNDQQSVPPVQQISRNH